MLEMPKIPTSFSEFVDLTIVTGSAAAAAVGSFAQNAYTSLSGNKEVGCNEDISLLHRPYLILTSLALPIILKML